MYLQKRKKKEEKEVNEVKHLMFVLFHLSICRKGSANYHILLYWPTSGEVIDSGWESVSFPDINAHCFSTLLPP